MKIGVTGSEGFVGSHFVQRGCIPIVGDIRDKKEIGDAIKSAKVDAIIHCASLTDVEYCETHFTDAFQVNALGTSNVLEALTSKQRFVYLSTDHVFPGKVSAFGWNGYQENHKPSPVNLYGQTKWAGELCLTYSVTPSLIVRSSKVFSEESLHDGIVKLREGTEQEYSKLICRSFLHIDFLVSSILDLIYRWDIVKNPIINVAGDGVMSYYQFWYTIADRLGYDASLIHGRNTELKDVAPRPFVAGLNVGLLKRMPYSVVHPVESIQYLVDGL